MTHATQLALMMAWAGGALHGMGDPIRAWRRAAADPMDTLWMRNACDLTNNGRCVSRGQIPSCPSCAVLLDQAHEVAP